MLSNPPTVMQPLKWLAVMEICNVIVLSVPSLVVGILALAFYGDAKVQSYFAHINGMSS